MDWIRENKFLSGYIAIVVIGGGLLGYLLVSARSAYQATMGEYSNSSTAVAALERKSLHPDIETLKLVKDETGAYRGSLDGLHNELLKFNRPLASGMTGGGLQQKLTEKVVALKKRSVLEKIGLPETFSLGMEKYTAELPLENAVAELDFQLDALDYVANALFDSKISEIGTFERVTLPVEAGGEPASSSEGSDGDAEAANAEDAPAEYTQAYSVRVCFKGVPGALEDFVNRLGNTGSDEFFFNIDYLTLANSAEEGPEKGIEFEAGVLSDEGLELESDDDASTGDAADNGEGVVDSRVVLGNETLEVCMVVGAVRFADVPKAEAGEGSGN